MSSAGGRGQCAAPAPHSRGSPHRERTGRGQEVTVSLLDAYVQAHEVNWQNWSVAEGAIDPMRAGSDHPVVGGVGVFDVGGGAVVIAAVNDRQWQGLCEVMGREELASHPDFIDGTARAAQRVEANDAIRGWLATESDRDDVVEKLEAARVPCAPVLSLAEAAEHPFLHEEGALRWVDDDKIGQVLVPGMPIRFSEYPEDLPLAARSLGADNRYVACELAGRSAADYDDLVAAGVLRHDPDS